MGAPEDLEAFCDRHYGRLVGALTLYCGRRDVAREIAQEAMLRVCERWESVSTMSSPDGWLMRVGFNLARSRFRRARAERRAVRRMTVLRQPHVPEVGVDGADPLRVVVEGLPERMRTALVLRFYLDLPTVEVAEHMGISESSVRSTVHRALTKLRESGVVDADMEVSDVH